LRVVWCSSNKGIGMFRYIVAVFLVVMNVGLSNLTFAQRGPSVPSALLAWADRSPVEFAMALAYASVPAGLEIRESDDIPPSTRPQLTIDPARNIQASELARAFNSQRSDYDAALMGRVLVIRPTGSALPFLDQPSPIDSPLTVTGLMAAAREVFSVLDPGLRGPILNSLGRDSDRIPIVLDGRGARKVIDTLNQIVLQAAPSHSWFVTTRKEPDGMRVVAFGIIEANGTRRTQRLRHP
jgi:hypothetical protein